MARAMTIEIDGVVFDEFTSGEVTRDLEEFAGSFSFTLRDGDRSISTFDYASVPRAFRLRPGPAVKIKIHDQVALVGWIENVDPDIDEEHAEVTISGRDKAGNLVDSAALTDGPSEFHNVKIEDAAKKIIEPFDLKIRNEIDTGAPFSRYTLDLAETAFAAIEKGARKRNALILSDGVGGLVITRTGADKAPAGLNLPGNVKRSSASFSHENRHSETMVRGQGEKAGGADRGRPAAIDKTAEPLKPEDRKAGDGSATERERKGTAATGRSRDPEITRHRPIVHLARTKADAKAAQDEADWRSRTARVDAESVTHTVRGYGIDGALWKVNQIVPVSDAYQGINRDMLISSVTYSFEDLVEETQITLKSPEGFDEKPVRGRRKNSAKSKRKGGLDDSAQAL